MFATCIYTCLLLLKIWPASTPLLADMHLPFHLTFLFRPASQAVTDSTGDSLLARCIQAFHHRNLTEATVYGLQAAERFHQQKRFSDEANCYIYLSEINKQLGTIDNTLAYSLQGVKYARKACAISESIRDTATWIQALNGLGIIFRDIGQLHHVESYYDSARACYLQALHLIRLSNKSPNYIPKLYNNLSQVYTEHDHDYATALQYLFKAIAINQQHHNLTSLSYNYGNVAQVYQLMGNMQQSIAYARKTVAAAEMLGMPDRLLNAYEQTYESFKAAHQYDSALYYYEKFNVINDSMATVQKTQQIADMQTRYETLQKESTIRQLDIQNRAKTQQITLLVTGLLVLGLLLGLLSWLYFRTEKQKKLIAHQSDQLKVLMKELHHRVKNNLQIVSSLLSLQSYKTRDSSTQLAFRESQQRVLAMSLIHQRLYQSDQLTAIDIGEYLTSLAESVITAFGYDPDQCDLVVKTSCKWLDIEKALPLGLIANEILTNACKYAFPHISRPLLHIHLEQQNDQLMLTISHYGKDWDKHLWTTQQKSFGSQLVTTLCKQLHAHQDLTIVNGMTSFAFSIPQSA